jgi:hypothetical protein
MSLNKLKIKVDTVTLLLKSKKKKSVFAISKINYRCKEAAFPD